MSEERDAALIGTLTGDWWWIAGRIEMLLSAIEQVGDLPFRWEKAIEAGQDKSTGLRFKCYLGDATEHFTSLLIYGPSNKTFIAANTLPSLKDFWAPIVEDVRVLARNAREIRRLAYQSSPDGAIERYYRVRAQGGRITLGEVAADAGFTEAYLRKVKVDYDKAGKWGSKRKR